LVLKRSRSREISAIEVKDTVMMASPEKTITHTTDMTVLAELENSLKRLAQMSNKSTERRVMTSRSLREAKRVLPKRDKRNLTEREETDIPEEGVIEEVPDKVATDKKVRSLLRRRKKVKKRLPPNNQSPKSLRRSLSKKKSRMKEEEETRSLRRKNLQVRLMKNSWH
jgi:hypothetical protein